MTPQIKMECMKKIVCHTHKHPLFISSGSERGSKMVTDWSAAASHLHVNQYHVTQLLSCDALTILLNFIPI